MSCTQLRAGPVVPAPLSTAVDTLRAAVDALRAGRPVLVLDDADREDEGDVVLAAERATPAWVAWTVRHTSGLLCAPMPPERADALALPDMVAVNQDPKRTAYTVTVDAAAGVSTGISAADRAHTARVLADPAAGPGDLIRPGHVLPLRARPGGVLERGGHTEAAVDLCRLAGLEPVGLIAELVHDDGRMMRGEAVHALAAEHDLPVLTIAQLVAWRRHREGHGAPEHLPPAPSAPQAPSRHDGHRDDGPRNDGPRDDGPRVQVVARAALPTRHGDLVAVGYRDVLTGAEHVAVVSGPLEATALVRVHSECLTGDALGSLRCDCGPQLQAALERIGVEGGVVVYLRGHEGRGIGLLSKLRAYALQEDGADTVEANTALGLPVDAREYGGAAAVLRDLGVQRVRLLTNNPAKVEGLREHGIDVVERLPLHTAVTAHNAGYLATKAERMGHHLATGADTGADMGADDDRDGHRPRAGRGLIG